MDRNIEPFVGRKPQVIAQLDLLRTAHSELLEAVHNLGARLESVLIDEPLRSCKDAKIATEQLVPLANQIADMCGAVEGTTAYVAEITRRLEL